MKTLQDIAETLKIPPSTIRYQAKNFKEFLPSQKPEGNRWEQYEDEAVEILRKVFQGLKQGKNRGEIKQELSKKHKPIFDIEPEGDSNKEPLTATNRQLMNNQPIATMLQQTTRAVFETAELNKTLLEQLGVQNQLLKEKDKTITRLQQKLEAKTKEARENKNLFELEQEEHSETQRKLEKAKKGGLLKQLLG